ncbi:5'-nucleotidase C-terminal domain-containing protein [Halobaculum sp. MBLA0147]|uniref:5'-nucleotidase C-terminal domain-containing protein n=1 Tax=Halobaculum sp. MBLA0147 TaxID=3079934 RepID=UPI0035257990
MSGDALPLFCLDDLERLYDDPGHVGRLAGLLRSTPSDAVVVGAGDDTALGTLAVLAERAGTDATPLLPGGVVDADSTDGGVTHPDADGTGTTHADAGASDETTGPDAVSVPDRGRGLAGPLFDAVAHDAETVGNHDLDLGGEWATEWVDRVPATYCCANLVEPELPVPGHTVVERDDTRVGIVGVTHPDLSAYLLAREAAATDPVPAAREELAALRDRGVDHTVVLSHCGAHDERVARETDADAVVGAHVHERLLAVVDGTPLVRSGGPDAVVELALGAADPSVTVHRLTPQATTGADDDTPSDGADDATAGDTRLAVDLRDATDAPVHEPTRDRYRALRTELGADEPVATVAESIRRGSPERTGGESRAGNFLADAIRTAVGTDCALFFVGSMRAGPPLSGTVDVGDVVSLAPFDDTVRELRLTGAELRQVLADCGTPHPGDRGWVHVHVAGLRVRWDETGALRSVRLVDDESNAADAASPLPETETYRVATQGAFVETDGYGPADSAHVVREDTEMLPALVRHAADGGLNVGVEGRIGRGES